MSLDNITTQLQLVEESVQGIMRAYKDMPKLAPQPPDLPAIVNWHGTPFPGFNFVSVAEIYYQWNFDIMLLFKVIGQGTFEEWDAEIEPYPARIVSALLSHLTLNGNCTDQNWRGNPRLLHSYQYLDTNYFAWVLPWQVNELVPISIAP